MAALTYYASDALLDLTLRGTAFASPANVYIALMTAAGDASGGGTATGAREGITFAAAASGAIASNSSPSWAPLDAGSAHTIVGWSIWDTNVAGNMLAFHTLGASVIVPAGRTCTFASGNITVTSNGSAMKDYLANKWLDHLFRNVSYTAPADCYLGLYRAVPTRSTGGTEESDSAYARQLTEFDVAASGVTANTNLESWVPLLADADETELGWALSDDATAGNQLWFGTWSSPQSVFIGDQVDLGAGDLTLTVL